MPEAPALGSPRELGIMYSHTCNIACRHCGIESGPHNHARMRPGLAEAAIRQAASYPGLRTIVFTGGEPFVFLADLDRLVGLSYDLGLSTRVITNGFWARDRRRGRAILRRLQLAGLDMLNFSADKYHLEFMGADIFRSAVDLAREVGFVVIVNFTVNEPGDPVEAFARLYGWDRDDVRHFGDDAEFRALALAAPEQLHTRLHLTTGRLIGLGRAAQHPGEHMLSPRDFFPALPCGEIVNRPVVYPDGDLLACCCAGGKIAEFVVGNMDREPLDTLFDRMRARTHFRFINALGPRRLHEAVTGCESEDGRLHASICDICVAATRGRDPEATDRRLEHWLIARSLGGSAADATSTRPTERASPSP